MEQVCYGEDERHRALDELDSLVEKGLVRVVGSGERYALLETIRAFAAEQLHAGGEVDAIRHAHADYFLAIRGRGGCRHLRDRRSSRPCGARRDDNANTQAAIQWLTACARAGDMAALEKGLLLCGHLELVLAHRRRSTSPRACWLDALLALAADRPPSRGRALARLAAGMVSTTTGEWERSLREWAGRLTRTARRSATRKRQPRASWVSATAT